MRLAPLSFVALGLASALSTACASPTPAVHAATVAPDILPLRSVRLYETGVGYFERSGGLAGHTAASLPVPAGHLDDALATLVVLSGGVGGKVAGLSFASSVTKATARSTAGLPADPASPIAFQDLLESMKGAKVTITARNADVPILGRVVEVAMEIDEARARALAEIKDASHADPKRLVVTLLTDKGEVTRVPAEDIVRIRPTDPAFAARLDAALDALGTRSAENARALKLLGDARGQVTFGYIAETPIWRASYRLIEGEKTAGGANAVLQGWALSHNDTDESWHDVHLELVNGEPDSFVFPMAAPRYARRALVHPDDPLSTVPQLQDTTADALWGDNLDSFGTIGHGYGTGGGYGGFGAGHTARAPTVRMGATTVDGTTSSSSLLSVGNLADLAPASGAEQGAFFVYAVPDGLSLDAHASGLVPFVQRSLSIERLAFFSAPGVGARAAVRFINGTGQTLPAGTLSFFGDGGFLGETTLDRLKPGERRFLQVGNDLDAEVTEKKTQTHDESKRLTFDADVLHEHFLQTTDATWELENRAGATRTFYVALSAGENAKVTGADRLDFDEVSSRPVVIFDVKPKEKVQRTLRVVEGLSRALTMDGLTEKVVNKLLAKAAIPADELSVLRTALPRVRALEAGHAAVAAADRATEVAQQDLGRLRDDLKALGGSAAGGTGEVAAPLVKRVVLAEDAVGAARRNKGAAAKTLDDRREELREALKKPALTAPE
jgi:hypothetical protein